MSGCDRHPPAGAHCCWKLSERLLIERREEKFNDEKNMVWCGADGVRVLAQDAITLQ